jgi:ABC-2 type transport system ATP-binding protein
MPVRAGQAAQDAQRRGQVHHDAHDHGPGPAGRGTGQDRRESYGDLRWPLREVGALLEAKAFRPGRTARAHLTALAASNAIGQQRVEEVLTITGIERAADRRAGKFSLGMSQRLGIAAALLGDPAVLLLDEPVNGLDPEGIRWIRNLMKNLAPRAGRCWSPAA